MTDQVPTQPIEETIIFEFQHTDEKGNPIIDPRTGKQGFTNLTGKSWQEIAEKQKEAYINVTRALVRARNHKPVAKEPEPQAKELSPEEERQAAADLQDPLKARAAVRKLSGSDDIEAQQKAAKDAKYKADAQKAAYQFMSSHMNDYYPCQANSAVLSKFITDNELDPTVVDNYEVAFNAVQNQLAERPAPPAQTPAPIQEIVPPSPPKKESSGGIQPGELSGQRPAQRKKNEITKEAINEMRRTPEGRAEYSKRMRDATFVAAVNAAFQT